VTQPRTASKQLKHSFSQQSIGTGNSKQSTLNLHLSYGAPREDAEVECLHCSSHRVRPREFSFHELTATSLSI